MNCAKCRVSEDPADHKEAVRLQLAKSNLTDSTIKRMMGGQKPQGKPTRDGFSVLAYNMLRLKLQITGSLFPFPHSLVA